MYLSGQIHKIYIAGHNGMVGSAITRSLQSRGYINLVYRTSSELDLTRQDQTEAFISAEKPDVVIIAAARVGGILANDTYPYRFINENLQIQNNLIDAAHRNDVKKLIFLGSSCIYPKLALQPLKEEYLLTGPLEPTNQWYAVAKIAGIKMVEALRREFGRDYISMMPTNLYGPGDNFDLKSSHVLPAMIRKFYEAKVNGHAPVTLWGSGSPMREFLYVEDLADAVVFAMENNLPEPLYNAGTGTDLTIRELAEKIQRITGHKGEIVWDKTKPDGTPRKLMDISRMERAGWKAGTGLDEGIRKTCDWFLEHQNSFKQVKMGS